MKSNQFFIGVLICSFTLFVSTAGAFSAADVDIHGFASQGYLKSDDNNYLANTEDGTAEFTEVGINFSKEFDQLRIGLQLLSRDLGDYGDNEIYLDWAMGDYRFNEMLGIRIGKVKTPVGLYNQERDLDMLRIPVLLPAAVYDEGPGTSTTLSRGLNSTAIWIPMRQEVSSMSFSTAPPMSIQIPSTQDTSKHALKRAFREAHWVPITVSTPTMSPVVPCGGRCPLTV